MIDEELGAAGPGPARATSRQYLTCLPEHCAVSYAINPWMDPGQPTHLATATRPRARLRKALPDLGHHVPTVEPVAGLPPGPAQRKASP